MARQMDVTGWAAVVRLKRATERYVRELTAAIPAVTRLAATDEQLGQLVDALIDATDLPPSAGSVTHLAQVLREIRLPAELFIEE